MQVLLNKQTNKHTHFPVVDAILLSILKPE